MREVQVFWSSEEGVESVGWGADSADSAGGGDMCVPALGNWENVEMG